MTLDEFAPEEDYLSEISRKLSNVSITKRPSHGVIINKCDVRSLDDNRTEFLIVA